MRHSLKIPIYIILTFLFYGNSKACTCDPPAFAFLDSTELKEYDFIAWVKIIDAYDSKKPSKYNYVKIQILELFKGKAITQIVEDGKNSSCDIGISDGEEWILFCKKDNGKITQLPCDRYERIREFDGKRMDGFNSDFNPLWKLRQFYGHPEKKFNTEIHKEYYSNGQIEIEEYYLNGKLEGERKMWYPNGQVLSIDTFVNGKLSGLSRSWHSNGVLESYSNYMEGNLEGKSERFFPSGQISSISYRKNNKPYNVYQTYFDTTIDMSSLPYLLSIYKTPDSLNLIYKKIQIQDEWIFDANGDRLIAREYFRNGKIKQEEIFVLEFDFTIQTHYHENGSIQAIGYKKEGISYGHYQLYDENGLPTQGWDYDEIGNVIKK